MMDGKWQFSIGYLLLEMFWIGVVLGIVRSLPALLSRGRADFTLPVLCVAIGVAMGGVVGRMKSGAAVGISVWLLVRFLALLQSWV